MKVRHSASVKVTGVGIAFLAILFLTLVAAINENNSVALLLASILLGLFIVTFVKGALNILPLRLAQLEFDNTFAGERVHVRGALKSRFRFPGASLDIVVASTMDRGRCSVTRLDASSGFSLTLPPHKRGRLQLESLEISSSYPISLLNWSIRFDGLATAGLIYPTPVDYLVTPDQARGQTQTAAIGDFDELQTWQNGDPLSGVCWKTYAKTGKRMRKRFLDAGADSWPASMPVTENDAFLDGDSLPLLSDEELRSQLCFWIVERQRRQAPYGLRFRGQIVETASGPQHYERCLETLTEN